MILLIFRLKVQVVTAIVCLRFILCLMSAIIVCFDECGVSPIALGNRCSVSVTSPETTVSF